ncbi:glutamate 5-kinase [uncultured Bifidobacterium sp.]|uniref:glutamate 5-kinase n=1 Tax=uncultured Bifidobacterium sp. TaxID=165187 RepID=UPI00260F6C67|nr:glutamate 5-kinase [uncultured Bifidobacterium sp.]
MTVPTEDEVRSRVAQARTIVVKIGSSSLTDDSGHLDVRRLRGLVGAVAHARMSGARVVVVSSGAIAAGFGLLGFDERPTDMVTQQATASVGQGLLMAHYESAFAKYSIRVGQILLTAQNTIHAAQYRNAQRTLSRMLDLGVVPIVNENDALASNEIRFGDNDHLSALVANIVRADALVLLTDVDGLYTAPPSSPGARRIGYVPDVVEILQKVDVAGSGSGVGTGGMVTKIEAARIAAVSGIPTVLASAADAGPAVMGDPVGTVVAPIRHRGSSRRLWIGFAAEPRGSIVADAGAAAALASGRASLLAAGVVGTSGDFSAGDPVWVDDENGRHLAKGLSGFDSEEIPRMAGRRTTQLRRDLGAEYVHPVVHRDDLVLVVNKPRPAV